MHEGTASLDFEDQRTDPSRFTRHLGPFRRVDDGVGLVITEPAAALALPCGVRALYPFESHYLRLRSGRRLHYLDEGTGPVLLMLHGNPTWSFYYRNLVLGLRNSYRCIVPDHLGCGLSDKPEDWGYGIAGHADNIAELLTNLELREITLVTHDWGGPIGYLAAVRAPGLFKRFVTFNTGVSMLALPKLLTMLRIPLLGPMLVRGLNGMVRAGITAGTSRRHRLPPDVRAGYLAPYDSWAHRIAILRFVQEIPLDASHPNRRLLAELERELPQFVDRAHLVVWGMRDPVFDGAYLTAWRQQFPKSEVHRFEDVSHLVVEEAHERILPLMKSFLARTS